MYKFCAMHLKIGTDDRYNKVKKYTKFQNNDGDMTLSNFDVMLDNL